MTTTSGTGPVGELLADDPVPLGSVEHLTGVLHLMIILLERTAQWLVTAPARDRRLSRALAGAQGRFTWVVIDCPPSLGALTENALMAADAVLIPCRMEARATDGVKGLLEVPRICGSGGRVRRTGGFCGTRATRGGG